MELSREAHYAVFVDRFRWYENQQNQERARDQATYETTQALAETLEDRNKYEEGVAEHKKVLELLGLDVERVDAEVRNISDPAILKILADKENAKAFAEALAKIPTFQIKVDRMGSMMKALEVIASGKFGDSLEGAMPKT